MQADERTDLRRVLDEALLPFRLARKGNCEVEGVWLKGMRMAIGLPVETMARRIGISRWEVHRMERSERNDRITLGTLRRAAEGLGCKLVYGLVPKEGTLEELAAEVTRAREIAAKKRQRKLDAAKRPLLEAIGWQETWMQAMRASMRRDGYRVRAAKTDRNVANQIEEFGMKLKMLQMAGALGPFVKEYLEERERREGENEG